MPVNGDMQKLMMIQGMAMQKAGIDDSDSFQGSCEVHNQVASDAEFHAAFAKFSQIGAAMGAAMMSQSHPACVADQHEPILRRLAVDCVDSLLLAVLAVVEVRSQLVGRIALARPTGRLGLSGGQGLGLRLLRRRRST